MQPAEERFCRSDAPGQRFGAARHRALFFHPLELAVELFGGDGAQRAIGRQELGQDAHEVIVLPELVQADSEVVEALTSLGYSVVEAQRALQAVPGDVLDVSERLRLALQQLAR